MKKILVATDFSETSTAAFLFGIDLAKGLNAEILLVYVKNTTDLRFALQQGIDVEFDSSEELRQTVQEYIDRSFAELLSKTDYKHIQRKLLKGEAGRELSQLARDENAYLLVCGTKGIGFTAHLLGSTARDLIHFSPCPVVTVRP